MGLALPVVAGLPVNTAGDPPIPALVAGAGVALVGVVANADTGWGWDETGTALVGGGAGTEETCDT